MMNALFDRIYGALIGSAIGDAMGGPVEGLHFREIAERFGRVDTLLPYTHVTPSYHGPFDTRAGAYTDDTRISIMLAKAAIHAGGLPKKGDITHALAEYYFNAPSDMERGFIEEYYLKGLYGDEKEVFGGRPTNGGIMGIASLGAIFPAAPQEAFGHVFRNLYISTGTARSASAFAAAMIAAAMQPGITWKGVMDEAFSACAAYKREVEASGWRNSELYPIVALKTEQMARIAMEMGAEAQSVDELRQELYDALVQPFFADGNESLALAVAMFCAARGDFAETVIGCVNFGRDNDSSAAVGGAVAGALCGVSGIDTEWVELVEHANPAPSLRSLAERLTGLTMRRYKSVQRTAENQAGLFFGKTAGVNNPVILLPDIAGEEEPAEEIASRIEELLKGGTDPDQQDAAGKTALHVSAAAGNDNAVCLLLLYGADINCIDNNGTTPLHFAAWLKREKSVRLLLEMGADADIAEGSGWTALHDAVRREYAGIAVDILAHARGLSDIDIVRSRLETLDGDPLFLALLELLAGNQVCLDSVGICSRSLLHDAVERGYAESVEFLIHNGVDINRLATSFKDTVFAGTPLHTAAAGGYDAIYKILLKAGADETILNIDGKTPPEMAGAGR